MYRWTIKKVVNGEVENDISTGSMNRLMSRLEELKSQGIECWDCDNVQEMMVG